MFVYSCEGVLKNTKKTRRLSKEEIKKQLIDSITINNIIKTEELNEKDEKVKKPEDAAPIIKQYGISFAHKKNIMSIAYDQGKVFNQFKEKKKFIKLFSVFKVLKSTIIFNTNIFKLLDKHPKFMRSSVTLVFSKTIERILSKFVKKIQTSLNR